MTRPFRKISVSLVIPLLSSVAFGQMVTGSEMPGFGKIFGLEPRQQAKGLVIQQLGTSLGTNLMGPTESGSFTFRVTNETNRARTLNGRMEIIGYGTQVPLGDIWVPRVFATRRGEPVPVKLTIPARASQTFTIRPTFPRPYGSYAMVADFGPEGRLWAGTAARVVPPNPGRVKIPRYAIDMPWPHEISEPVAQTFLKLGVKGARMGASYTPTTSPEFADSLKQLDQHLKWCFENNITVMLTIGAGSAPQPLGRGRPWLKPDDTLIEGVKEDLVWHPAYDEDFQRWTRLLCERYGWPKGPVNAVELWNEPWEGVSISGWGADLPRYRELYERMGRGVMEARARGAQVLIGGASSSSNTLDKLFPDGKDTFLPMLDFVSIHYQGPGATPCLVPMWMDRKSPLGRTQVWDTESWVANSEDRVPGAIASMMSFGQDRAMGTYGGNVYRPESHDVDGKNYRVVQAWSMAPAVATVAKYIGQRSFRSLLFSEGLPWIYEFNGDRPGDDTFVVLGELGRTYNPNTTLYRSASRQISQRGGFFSFPAAGVLVLDYNGNPVSAQNGRYRVPLGGAGYYVRANGLNGGLTALRQRLRNAQISGYPAVEIVARDFLRPISPTANLRLSITNILNRPTMGQIRVTVNGVKQSPARITVGANRTAEIQVPVRGVKPAANNLYNTRIEYVSPAGTVQHREKLRVNLVAKRAITVDGNLSDWAGVLPQPIDGDGIRASMTEEAWLPFKERQAEAGRTLTNAFVAADDAGFYFAARIQDPTPYPGNIRFENRDDDSYYYPATAFQMVGAASGFSVRWSGSLVAPATGSYDLIFTADDGVRVWVDGQMVIDAWRHQGATPYTAPLNLTAGKPVPIRIEYYQAGGGAFATLEWRRPDDTREIIPSSALPGGLRGEFFSDIELTKPMGSATDAIINFRQLSDQFPNPAALPRERSPLAWPEGVRRFSYRRDPDLPAGIGTDNVQIAFNVLAPEDKDWRPHPRGVMPRYMHYPDTDYEYALNTVAPEFGGGTELFRLLAPGMPRKHFYPRQPSAPIDGGPVKAGRLVTTRVGTERIVEMFLPWSEIPHVKKRRDAGLPIKFTYRVNDNQGPAYELAHGRSVSKENSLTFHNDWVTHWSNELEFAFER